MWHGKCAPHTSCGKQPPAWPYSQPRAGYISAKTRCTSRGSDSVFGMSDHPAHLSDRLWLCALRPSLSPSRTSTRGHHRPYTLGTFLRRFLFLQRWFMSGVCADVSVSFLPMQESPSLQESPSSQGCSSQESPSSRQSPSLQGCFSQECSTHSRLHAAAQRGVRA